MARWAIVGGGILGCTLALRLSDRGEEVTLFEAADSIGGLASAWSLGPLTWDRHYHVTLLSDRHTRGLLRELGLEAEMQWVETRTGSYFDGQLHSVSNSIEFLKFPPLSLVDKFRLATTILYGSRLENWQRLEQIPVTDWLTRLSGRRVFERFWLPLLEAKLGEAYHETSAAFIWATIQRLYAARKSGLKREMFGYVPGGYARILERLAIVLKERGVEIRLQSPVEAVRGGPSVTCAGIEEGFDRVVLTAPTPVIANVVEGLTEDEISALDSVRYQGIVCASLLIEQPLADFYLTYLHDPAPFTAVVEMSAFVDPSEFGGRSLVYLPKYCSPDDPLLGESDDYIRSRFLEALSRLYPDFDPSGVVAFRVSRVRRVFAVSTIGYSSRIPPFDTSISGVHVVTSAQICNGTLNVNETIELAERGLRHLCDEPRTAESEGE